MKIEIKRIPSSDKLHTLCGRVYVPDGKPKGYFHIVHGMCEHIGRYDSFMERMCREGYICFGYDNLGHGETADSKDLGYIADKHGWMYLCRDVEAFAREVRREYGDLPYYLMGHSMGSFIVRLAVTMESRPEGLIVMGTGGKNPMADVGVSIMSGIAALKGKRHVSNTVYAIVFGPYNKRFADELDAHSWISSIKEERDAYHNDPYCRIKFTVSAMMDLTKLNKYCNSSNIFNKTPKDLPVLIVSGEDDPVGDYGAGVKGVYEGYTAAGVKAEMKLYEGCRHEILNDKSKEMVIEDIFAFIDSGRMCTAEKNNCEKT